MVHFFPNSLKVSRALELSQLKYLFGDVIQIGWHLAGPLTEPLNRQVDTI